MEPISEALSSKVDLAELNEAYSRAVRPYGGLGIRRVQRNVDARLAWWPGQTDDGRKHAKAYGHEVFPWEGASDSRVNLVDMYVTQDVSLKMATLSQMSIQVHGVESQDAEWSRRMTTYLRWQLLSNMPEAPFEFELAANYLEERGAAVMGVFWHRARQLEYRVFTMEDVQRVSLEATQAVVLAKSRGVPIPKETVELSKLLDMVLDETPAGDGIIVDTVLPRVLGHLTPARRKKVLDDLRANGVARFPYPYLKDNRPKVLTLGLHEDFFMSDYAGQVRDAREVFRREYVTETELMDRVESQGYDRAWVSAVVKTCRGRVSTGALGGTRVQSRVQGFDGMYRTDGLFEIVHRWSRKHDREGVPVIQYTVFAPGVVQHHERRGAVGIHEHLNYSHGDVPFVLWRRESRTRRVAEVRGVGEILDTIQSGVKREWDSQADRASISTLPPSYEPPGEEVDRWGPGVRVQTDRPDGYGFFRPPAADRGSEIVERQRRAFADELMGRSARPEYAPYENAMRQHKVDNWLRGCREVSSQVIALCQQFEADQIYFRVVGSAQGKPIRSTRQEIQGRYDISVYYNAQRQDPEYAQNYQALLEKWLSMDVNGVVDRDEAMVVAAEMIDPNLGERLLRDGESASQKEIEDTHLVYAQLRAGVPVNIKPGQAYQMRLQVLTQLVQSDPEAMQQLQEGGRFADVFTAYTKQLQHQLQQRQNAQIGRLGAMAQ